MCNQKKLYLKDKDTMCYTDGVHTLLLVLIMKYRTYIILIISILTFSCSEKKSKEIIMDKYPNGNPKSVNIFFDKESYILKDYYLDGKLEFEGKIVNEKFVEYKKSYFENGALKEKVQLSDSADLDYCCPDGYYEMYNKNGNLKQTHILLAGELNGLLEVYDSLGIIIVDFEMENDLKNGNSKKYHLNGKISSIKKFRNDTLTDISYFFNESGDSIKTHGTYKGQKDFPFKYWKKNGNTLEGKYYQGKFDKVEWKWRDSLGSVIKTEILDTNKNGQFITPEY
jgi:antitoxin component YwqK of YwqJK toxin-antitoxin module